jgi:hypothetical protein
MALPSGHYHDHWGWSPGPIAGMPESAVPITSVPIPMVNVRVIMTPIVMVITPMCLCARSHRQKDCRNCNQAQEKLFHNLILSVSVTAGLRPLRHEIVVSTARATDVQVAFLQGELCFWLLEAQELSFYWERASRNRDELVATKGKAGLTFADLVSCPRNRKVLCCDQNGPTAMRCKQSVLALPTPPCRRPNRCPKIPAKLREV